MVYVTRDLDSFNRLSIFIHTASLLLEERLSVGYTLATNGRIHDRESRERILLGLNGESA